MTLQPPKESPQGAQRVSTLVKRSETPRFLRNENNAIGGSKTRRRPKRQRAPWPQYQWTDQWRRRHQRVCKRKEHFRDVIDASSIFLCSSSQCQ